MKVSVDAEIDLRFDVRTSDLVEALVETVGKQRAVEYINSCETRERGLVRMSEAEDELRALRRRMREAMDLIEAGRLDEGLRKLRLMCAPSVDVSLYQMFKDGKAPGYRPAA